MWSPLGAVREHGGAATLIHIFGARNSVFYCRVHFHPFDLTADLLYVSIYPEFVLYVYFLLMRFVLALWFHGFVLALWKSFVVEAFDGNSADSQV